MSLLGLLKGKGPNGFGFLSTADDVLQGVELSDKVFLVTGVNSGLGLETARALTARGATIIGLARTEEKAKTALASISADKGIPVACELSEPTRSKGCGRVGEGTEYPDRRFNCQCRYHGASQTAETAWL